jgi:hypothetical protein
MLLAPARNCLKRLKNEMNIFREEDWKQFFFKPDFWLGSDQSE